MPLIQAMKSIRTILTLLALWAGCVRAQQVGIGEWDSYFTYTRMYDVIEADQKIIWISELSALYYDLEDHSVQVFNKIHGLTQTGLSRIVYNAQTNTSVIGYNDGNLDLLSFDENNKATVINMSDIKRSSITGDKKIYAMYPYNQYLYISCGFGIVVLDLEKQEIKDTYIIGPASSQIKINGVTIGADTIYATTDNGVYKAYLNNPFLNTYTSWSKMTSLPSHLANKPFKEPAFIDGRLYLIPNYAGFGQDTTYYRSGLTWNKLPLLQGSDMINVRQDKAGRLVFVSVGNVTVTDLSYNTINSLFDYNGLAPDINNAVYGSDNMFYTADNNNGPFRCPNSYAAESLQPGGTKSSSVRRVVSGKDQLWVAAGSVSGSIFINTFNTDYFSVRENNQWTYINRTTDPLLVNDAYDVLDVAIDPTDPTRVMAAAWSLQGLIEIKDKKVTNLYDETNSILFSYAGNPSFCGVASVEYDEEGNLWCLNGMFSNYPLVLRTKDGNWKKFYCGPDAVRQTYYDIIVASNGYKYIPYPTTGTTGGGVTVYNDNGTLTDETDDEYYSYKPQPGLGNLPDADVKCVAEDLDGQIWIGTSKGPAVIYNPTGIFSGGNADAQQILIQQDGNTQVLLETETILCIEVDGANRKWIGTESSGVYLLSEDGQEQIFHFTTENSPLPSNTIYDIEIDGKSGEVYFATSNGLLSYRGTATSDGNFKNVKVFPNPVRPDYKGVIAINGLSRNSDVKVTDIAGNVVSVIKSEGGQATWDGTNLNGQRVSSGIYLFLCSSENGSNKVAAKVMFIE